MRVESPVSGSSDGPLVKMLLRCGSVLAQRRKGTSLVFALLVARCNALVVHQSGSTRLFYFCSSKLVRRARVAQPVAKAEMNWFVPCGKPLSKYS